MSLIFHHSGIHYVYDGLVHISSGRLKKFLQCQSVIVPRPRSSVRVSPTGGTFFISIRQYDRVRQCKLTAAAKSICPPPPMPIPPPLDAPPPRGAPPPACGLAAVGTGGLAGGFGAPGFAAIGGAGFGLLAIGGGGLWFNELVGLELTGVESSEVEEGVFFHGVAEPLDDPIPGNTETGLADWSATMDFTDTLGAVVAVAAGAVG